MLGDDNIRCGSVFNSKQPFLNTRASYLFHLQVSLRTAAARMLGVELDKELQTSDWGTRPLSPAQLRYAALDAHVLLRLAEGLAGRVDTLWAVVHAALPLLAPAKARGPRGGPSVKPSAEEWWRPHWPSEQAFRDQVPRPRASLTRLQNSSSRGWLALDCGASCYASTLS